MYTVYWYESITTSLKLTFFFVAYSAISFVMTNIMT